MGLNAAGMPRRSDKRRHYRIPDSSTIVLSEFQADQEVDHASTKSVGDEPDADDDAGAWNLRTTARGWRPVRSHIARWARPDQMSASLRLADSSRTLRKGREVQLAAKAAQKDMRFGGDIRIFATVGV
jgi:hypothetical protein